MVSCTRSCFISTWNGLTVNTEITHAQCHPGVQTQAHTKDSFQQGQPPVSWNTGLVSFPLRTLTVALSLVMHMSNNKMQKQFSCL